MTVKCAGSEGCHEGRNPLGELVGNLLETQVANPF